MFYPLAIGSDPFQHLIHGCRYLAQFIPTAKRDLLNHAAGNIDLLEECVDLPEPADYDQIESSDGKRHNRPNQANHQQQKITDLPAHFQIKGSHRIDGNGKSGRPRQILYRNVGPDHFACDIVPVPIVLLDFGKDFGAGNDFHRCLQNVGHFLHHFFIHNTQENQNPWAITRVVALENTLGRQKNRPVFQPKHSAERNLLLQFQ